MTEAAGFRLSPQQARLGAAGREHARARAEVEIEGPLDSRRLAEAMMSVIERHEILRTDFPSLPGFALPLQVVREAPAAFEFEPEGGSTGRAFRARLRVEGPDRHRLTISLPALSADARSLARIVEEIAAAYRGDPPSAGTIQYADYAEWRARIENAAVPPAQPATFLLGSPALGQGIESVSVPDLPPAALIDGAAARCGARGSDFLLACWQALLLRWTGESPTVARIVEGRDAEARDAAGLHAEALAASDPGSPASPLAELAAAHAASRPPRAGFLGLGDLPRVAFEAVAIPDPIETDGLRLTVVDFHAAPYPADLMLSCRRETARWAARLEYSPGAMAPADARSLAEAWPTLVAAAAGNPSTPIARLPITASRARARALVDFQRPSSPFPALLAGELVEAQARRHPDWTAVSQESGNVTYRELDDRARGIGETLTALGAGRGMLVGLCARPSADAIAAILGIWKSGAAYVPLHPDQPPSRLARQWSEARGKILLVDEEAAGVAPFTGATLRLEELADGGAGRSGTTEPPMPSTPEDLAYAIFTSGSSGEPKLVGVRHRNLVNYTMSLWQEILGGEEGLRFATPSSLAADLGHTALFVGLASAGTVAIIPEGAFHDADLFGDFMRQRAIDVLKIVPSHLAALFAGAGPRALPNRLVISGGEALAPDLARRVTAAGCRLVNHYGPTETTVGALTHGVAGLPAGDRGIPIGRPLANVRVYVLDDRRQVLPPGSAGELWIGGAGVSAGYLNRPEETAARFLEDPFDSAGGVMYRTGDRVRFLPLGEVEFLGRVDEQLKIRGHRVEPGEIEAVLHGHPAVSQAVVLGGSGRGLETEVVAYVVARDPLSSPSEIREFLTRHLPDAFVPARIVLLDALPVGAAGKIDRRRLREVEAAPRACRPPRNPVEEWIAGVWKEVMDLPEIGVDDDFFELGGHSLLATRVMARLGRGLPVRLPMRMIFRHRTIADLAEAVSRACEAIPSAVGAGR